MKSDCGGRFLDATVTKHTHKLQADAVAKMQMYVIFIYLRYNLIDCLHFALADYLMYTARGGGRGNVIYTIILRIYY